MVKMSTVLCKHDSDNSSISYLSTNYAKGHNQIVNSFQPGFAHSVVFVLVGPHVKFRRIPTDRKLGFTMTPKRKKKKIRRKTLTEHLMALHVSDTLSTCG